MVVVICLAAAVVGALGNRIRGGLFPIPGGTQVGRLVGWGLPVAAMAWLCGMVWWAAVLAGLGAFLGCCVGQYGGLSMGHRGPAPAVSPWLTMTVWGLARVAGPAVVVWWTGGAWWLVVASGLACAPIYWAVWMLPDWALRIPGLGRGTGPGEARDQPEVAEALDGALMLAFLAGAVLP